MKSLATRRLDQLVVALCLCMFAPAAMAHDMGNVLFVYALVLAIPIPALVVLMGWLRAPLLLIPIGALALWLANSGNYGLMYLLLFFPYVAWLGRAISRRVRRAKREA
jgi:hypothetical protein